MKRDFFLTWGKWFTAQYWWSFAWRETPYIRNL